MSGCAACAPPPYLHQGRGDEPGGPAQQQNTVPLGEEHPQALEEVAEHLALQPLQVSRKGSPDLGDGGAVCPPEGFIGHGDELDPLQPAGLTSLPHLSFKCKGEGGPRFNTSSNEEGLLEGGDNRDIQSTVLAALEAGEEDI